MDLEKKQQDLYFNLQKLSNNIIKPEQWISLCPGSVRIMDFPACQLLFSTAQLVH